jgi:hypothetical protein
MNSDVRSNSGSSVIIRDSVGFAVINPCTELQKPPHLKIRIKKAENIFLSFEKGKREKCDAHAEISYGTVTVAKTA